MPMVQETREIVSVRPWHAPEGTTGTWPCASCGTPHPVTDSWRVTYRTRTGPSAATVCQACATAAHHRTRDTA